ncbi:hypothetical protein HPQ61_23545 [Acetobacteraceae bacterium]|nr:hypothetical protein [Acetobacteraceae bacterium]
MSLDTLLQPVEPEVTGDAGDGAVPDGRMDALLYSSTCRTRPRQRRQPA